MRSLTGNSYGDINHYYFKIYKPKKEEEEDFEEEGLETSDGLEIINEDEFEDREEENE